MNRPHRDIATPPPCFPPLAAIDHQYEPFRKTFYEAHPDMAQLNSWEVKQLRNELQVRARRRSDVEGGDGLCMYLELRVLWVPVWLCWGGQTLRSRFVSETSQIGCWLFERLGCSRMWVGGWVKK